MIEHVYDRCAETNWEVCVVTDHQEVEGHLNKKKKKVLRVDDQVLTGSERIALAYKRHFDQNTYDMVINVQGDEPLITAESLMSLATFHQQNDFSISTLIKERTDTLGYENKNVVKALWSPLSNRCLGFSRASVPYYRDPDKLKVWWQHIGVYCYSTPSLLKFIDLAPSYLEQSESLEQLRAMENDMAIGGHLTKLDLIGVDVPEDILKVEERLRNE